ncbi:MAG: HEPN domain-containing protein [Candidatus Omnitrophota bacterium]
MELLNKSERSIDAAKLLLSDSYPDFAVSRAYYAMFYALQALMLDRNLAYSKHSAIIGAFGKEFVKTGIFDNRFHRFVLNAFDLRNAGDYGSSQTIDENKAARTIADAVEFLAAIKRHLAGDH